MEKEVVVLVAEDDIGHATLIKMNLKRAAIVNRFIHFKDGEELLDFLLRNGDGPHRKANVPYLLLLDIRMPKVDGVEALRKIKSDPDLKKLPVIMLTTTDDPIEIKKCYELGCNNYLVKPIEYQNFVEALKLLGLFLKIIEVPETFEKDA
ncbi:MAG: response regulator [Candidatus Kapaibacterium sp.]